MISRKQYIGALKRSLSVLKDEVDDVVLDDEEKKYLDEQFKNNGKYLSLDLLNRLGKMTKYIQGQDPDIDDIKDFIDKYKNHSKIEKYLKMFEDYSIRMSVANFEEIIANDKIRDANVNNILWRLDDANKTFEQVTGHSNGHLSLLDKSVKAMYLGISVLLIAISIFLIRYILKSDYWQKLRESAKQGNWSKFIVVLKGGLSLGLATFPAVLGISILVMMFIYKRDEEYLTERRVTRNIEDFFFFLTGLITKFIILPMIKLLNHIKLGKKK